MIDNRIRLQFDWVPKIHVMLVADDGRKFIDLPFVGGWLVSLSEQDKSLIKRSRLNRKQCLALWKFMGRTDRAPKYLNVFLSREDVERCFPLKQ